jgi:ABC-2 type transport system ATP-binding protein
MSPSPDSDIPLDVQGLTKRYRKLVAVDSLDLTIDAGQFVGLIGPNGAGKSTLMGCITGLLAADEGTVRVSGVDVQDDPIGVRQHVGFIPQDLELFDYLTGEEFLRFVADVRGVPEESAADEVAELLELAGLTDARHRIVSEYSGGMRRKIALVSALLGSPDLLLLDEAFVGLDPESTWRIRRRLASYCDSGGAIILSSHALEMIQEICDRVVILQDGTVRRDLRDLDVQGKSGLDGFTSLTELYLDATDQDAG